MKKIIIAGVVVVLIALGAWYFTKGSSEQQVSTLDVVDTVTGFYDQWLKAAQEPAAADPNRQTLAKTPILSKALKEKILAALEDPKTTTDPVLCQAVVPQGISTRKVFEDAESAQALITSKDKKVTEQAIVSLTRLNDGWYIEDIECSLGEFAPEREFSFEKEGFLLKASIPKPYDPKNWHLVFTENGEAGHVAPLFFDGSTKCIDLSGSESICKPETLTEATKVAVKAQMTERGAQVKQLVFVK